MGFFDFLRIFNGTETGTDPVSTKDAASENPDEMNAADDTASDETVSEETALEETVSGETASVETVSEKSASEEHDPQAGEFQFVGETTQTDEPVNIQDTETQSGEEMKEEMKEEIKEEIKEEMTEKTSDEAGLEPADVFEYFRRIAAIPHGSFHTKELSDYLENFAKEHSLEYVRDDMGNLIIARPASQGCEGAAPIALQGHIDMVCEKEASYEINMEKDPITLQTDGEWLWADRTTLGGDDGIAVAMMLALLVDDTVKCPPLECIFTVDEEVGLLGAAALDLSSLKSRRMINIDSEEEGIITAACAGGAEEVCTLSGKRHEKKGSVLSISVSGLRGGHSGEHIGSGRANADILMARLLYRLEKVGKYYLISINGGTRDNAIPRDSKAEILFKSRVRRGDVVEEVDAFIADIEKEYSVTDPDIRISTVWSSRDKEEPRIVFARKDSRRMIRFLLTLPNGVIEYSPLYRDVPQTSLSLGIVKTMADGIRTHSLVRSSVNSQKQMIMDRIECLAEEFGASVNTEGAYPAWELIEKSDFRNLAADVYRKVTGKDAKVCVTHGGLECGLLAAKVKGLDCISIGPDMEEIHTPAERLNIPSTKRMYTYIRELLAACCEAE